MNQSPKSVAIGDMKQFATHGDESSAKTGVDSFGNNDTPGIQHPRSMVFELAGLVGELCSIFLQKNILDAPYTYLTPAGSAEDTIMTDNPNDEEFSIARPNAINDEKVHQAMAKILLKLFELAHCLSLELEAVIVQKMQLNARKYPAELCRGKAGKYTEYSSITGITKDEGQSTLSQGTTRDGQETIQGFLESLERLTQDIGSFATERQWSRYHKPRNLILALLGELGEVSACVHVRMNFLNAK